MKKIFTLICLVAFLAIGAEKVSAQAITPTVTVTDATVCSGNCDGTATTNDVSSFGGTYLWSDPQAQTTMTATGLCPGTYSVTITIPSFGSATGSGTVGCSAGVNEYELNERLQIFPNPAFENISVKLSYPDGGTVKEISVFNSIGKKVLNEDFSSKRFTSKLFVGNLPSGVYFLELKDEKNSYRTKFIKE